MSYYSYLCETCSILDQWIESLIYEATCVSHDSKQYDKLFSKACELEERSDAIWDKASKAALYDA